RAVPDRETGGPFVMQSAAVGLADLYLLGGRDDAVPGKSLVVEEGAADDAGPGPVTSVIDGAALAEGCVLDAAVSLVADEGAVGDREDGLARDIADGPAPGIAGAADGNVVRED